MSRFQTPEYFPRSGKTVFVASDWSELDSECARFSVTMHKTSHRQLTTSRSLVHWALTWRRHIFFLAVITVRRCCRSAPLRHSGAHRPHTDPPMRAFEFDQWTIEKLSIDFCGVSPKNPPWDFLTFFPKRLGTFSPNCTCLLYIALATLDCKFSDGQLTEKNVVKLN